jgi:putative metallohydrolase (TIGR04338 family)
VSSRDVQRGRVYSAESLVRRIYDRASETGCHTLDLHGSTIALPIERRFASVDSMQRYVDLVLALPWVQSTWPVRAAEPVTVRRRDGQAQAHYERLTATIAIPPYERTKAWAMREFVLLHEIAHHLAPNRDRAPHGAEFVDRFATLVTEIVGPEAGLLLRTTMHENGVKMAVAGGVEL